MNFTARRSLTPRASISNAFKSASPGANGRNEITLSRLPIENFTLSSNRPVSRRNAVSSSR